MVRLPPAMVAEPVPAMRMPALFSVIEEPPRFREPPPMILMVLIMLMLLPRISGFVTSMWLLLVSMSSLVKPVVVP